MNLFAQLLDWYLSLSPFLRGPVGGALCFTICLYIHYKMEDADSEEVRPR